MSYASEILDRANAINTGAPASDLYLACKSLTEAGIKNIPLTLAAAIRARVLSPQTNDPYELAFLLKAMSCLDLWAIYGAWYIGGSNGVIRTLKNGVTTFPAPTAANLVAPSSVLVLNSAGSFAFPGSQTFPTWYEDETLLRVRVWGAGGGGAGGVSNYDIGAAGGGGGYAEALIRYGDIRAGIQAIVGAGGAGGVGANSGVAGGSSSFGSLLSATGGGGGVFDTVGASGTATNAAIGGAGGSGVGGFFNATGGAGGSNRQPGSMTDLPGSGGGSAAGPWGNGFAGGGIDPITGVSAGSRGGHSGAGTGAAGSASGSAVGALGGASAAYSAAWYTEFLQLNLGGAPVPSALDLVNARSTSGAGCGGAGQYFDASGLSTIYNGGPFGGGGGGASTQSATLPAGHGGIAAGGGGAGCGATNAGGNGGSGLIIVEWFV